MTDRLMFAVNRASFMLAQASIDHSFNGHPQASDAKDRTYQGSPPQRNPRT